jgi:hypothetical protein
MAAPPSVILVELNEFTPTFLHRFVREKRLPNFHQFYQESLVYETDAEEAQRDLEPWIQWVTIHSGLSAAEHGIRHLDEGHKLARPYVWDLLSAAGMRVWVCGSMNANYEPGLNGWVLPDPWCLHVSAHPADLSPYSRFVRALVLEHTNPCQKRSWRLYREFLAFALAHGLSIGTAAAVLGQLAREVLGSYRWRRPTILDRLQWDLFYWQYHRVRPHFATFFTNSVAHYQHNYWRDLEPERFQVQTRADWHPLWKDAIPYGYEQADRLLGRFLRLAAADTWLILCSGLSQQPCLRYEATGGKYVYRPHRLEDVFDLACVTRPQSHTGEMAEVYRLYYAGAAEAEAAAAKLAALSVGDQPAVWVEQEGPTLRCGCCFNQPVDRGAVLRALARQRSVPFYDLFYRVEYLTSGMHHPKGFLWVRRPDRRNWVCPEKVSIRSIAPSLLALFGLPRPVHMKGEPLQSFTKA